MITLQNRKYDLYRLSTNPTAATRGCGTHAWHRCGRRHHEVVLYPAAVVSMGLARTHALLTVACPIVQAETIHTERAPFYCRVLCRGHDDSAGKGPVPFHK